MSEVPEHMYVDAEHPHLGGYLKGGDAGSYYPELWTWLIEEQGVRSMIDVGCGEGHALGWFREHGCHVIGIDGIGQDDEDIVEHDYTTGPWPARVRGNRMEAATDLIWCCEFVEHIEEEFIPNFLETFLMGELVLMTHGLPGQGGHHHVNCQPPEYWIGMLTDVGFRHDPEFTRQAKAFTPTGYFDWSGLVFVRQ